MTKVVVTIELNEEAYRAKYGPGTEWWEEYMYDSHQDEQTGDWVKTPKPASEYKAMEGKLLYDSLIEILGEGFYDWASKGWLKMEIDGKVVRQCCKSFDGEEHQRYCGAVVRPEASA